jgi:hypothetical protein
MSRARHSVRIQAGILFGAVTSIALAVAACNSKATPDGTAPAVINDNPEPAGPPIFEDVTPRTGINFTYRNGEEAGNFAIIESLGGGVALFDFDGDGLIDIFLPGGGYYDGKKVLGHPCRLFRNLGNFKFEDVTKQVGLDSISFPYTHGAAAFDFDNDGWPDLLLTGYNRVVLLHNEPDGKGGRRFVDVTRKANLSDDRWNGIASLVGGATVQFAGLTDQRWSSCAAWGDLDGDGFPEIYVTHYGDWGFDTNHPTDCYYDGKTRDVCQPRRFRPLAHSLYRNNRDGTFTDVSDRIVPKTLGRGLGVMFVDANMDGRPDIYVANDTDDNFLFLNRGKPGEIKLEERGVLSGVARDERGNANGSMGIDAGDFDRSGLPSIIVTNYEGELPALYHNRTAKGKEKFTFGTMETGLAAITGSYVSWGTGFFDYDLDGWEDLMIVSGHAIRFPPKIDRRLKPALFHNQQGQYSIVTSQGGPYFREPHNARGAAFADLDNDGKIDVVINHLNEPVVILRNVAPTESRHWLGVDLVGKQNRDIVGARVVLETASGKQTRFVKGGASYASTNDRRLAFGMGADTTITKVTVYWPWGGNQEFTELKPDGYWRIVEGSAKAEKVEQKR